MSDRTSAEIFSEIYKLIAKTRGSKLAPRYFAQQVYKIQQGYDFNDCQLDALEALLKLNIARKHATASIIEEYGEICYGDCDCGERNSTKKVSDRDRLAALISMLPSGTDLGKILIQQRINTYRLQRFTRQKCGCIELQLSKEHGTSIRSHPTIVSCGKQYHACSVYSTMKVLDWGDN